MSKPISKFRQVVIKHKIERIHFARAVGVSSTCMYDYLSGRSWPRAENLRRIMNFLKPYGVTIEDILPDSPERKGKI